MTQSHIWHCMLIDRYLREGASADRNWRGQLAKVLVPLRGTMQPLLKGWLLTSPNGKESALYTQF